MRNNLFRSVFASALAATFLAATQAAQGSTTTVKGTFRCSYQQQVLKLVNQKRAANGLSNLVMTKYLTDVAMVRAAELSYTFSHKRPNGLWCESIIPWETYASENMAKAKSPAAVMDSWMNSPLHKKNILNTKGAYIGIGCFVRNGTCYWIQVFSDIPGGSASETRTGDKNATATIALNTGSSSSVTITGSSSGGSSSGGSSSSYCIISFNANGGKGKMAAQKVKPGVRFRLRKNAFTRSGYVFIGWAQSKNGSVVVGNQGTGTAGNAGSTTLYAKWAKSKYKVAFYANGGRGKMAAQTMTYGKSAKLRANKFTRKGYTFQGWAKSKNGKVVYKNKKAVKNLVKNGKTVKLYAKWAKNKYLTIKYYANGGKGKTVVQKFLVKKNYYPKTRKNTFTRPGYVFDGWYWAYRPNVKLPDPSVVQVYLLYSQGYRTLEFKARWKKK